MASRESATHRGPRDPPFGFPKAGTPKPDRDEISFATHAACREANGARALRADDPRWRTVGRERAAEASDDFELLSMPVDCFLREPLSAVSSMSGAAANEPSSRASPLPEPPARPRGAKASLGGGAATASGGSGGSYGSGRLSCRFRGGSTMFGSAGMGGAGPGAGGAPDPMQLAQMMGQDPQQAEQMMGQMMQEFQKLEHNPEFKQMMGEMEKMAQQPEFQNMMEGMMI